MNQGPNEGWPPVPPRVSWTPDPPQGVEVSGGHGGPPLTLTVDSREPAKMAVLLRGKGFEVDIKTLDSGDYAWNTALGMLGVERKTIPNLISDIMNGVAAAQLERLARAYTIPMLLIEGVIAYNAQGEMVVFAGSKPKAHIKEMALRNWIISRQLEGIYVDYCASGSSHERIAQLYKWSQEQTAVHRPTLVTRHALNPHLATIASLPGIGIVRGANLLAKHKSITNVLAAIHSGSADLPAKLRERIAVFLNKEVEWGSK